MLPQRISGHSSFYISRRHVALCRQCLCVLTEIKRYVYIAVPCGLPGHMEFSSVLCYSVLAAVLTELNAEMPLEMQSAARFRCCLPLPLLPLFFTLLLFFPTFIVVVVISAITSNECGGWLYRLQTYPGLCSSSLPLPSSSRSLYENCYLAQCRRFPAVPSVTLPLSFSLPHSEIKSHRLPMTMKLYQLYSGFFPWPGATAFVLAMLGSFAN